MIAFLGPSGTYTEQAAKFFASLLAEDEASIRSYSSISRVFDAVERGEAESAAVPIENSLEGSVLVTLDRLAAAPLCIVAEVALPIRHAIFGLVGTDETQVRQVLSHPQALAQCRQTLFEFVPLAEHVDVDSTAEAVDRVAKQGDRTKVCVGSVAAGRAAGLQLLRMDAQDIAENTTRFVLVAKESRKLNVMRMHKSDVHKTSLLLQLGDDHPGALYDVLKVFAKDELNLSRLESRPTKKGLGSYQFYIDVLGVKDDLIVSQAVQDISMIQGFSVRNLGSYPCFVECK